MFVVQQAQSIAKSGATLRQAQGKRAKFKVCASIPAKTNFIRFLLLNLTHKNSFWLASVQHFDTLSAGIESFGFLIRHYRQAATR